MLVWQISFLIYKSIIGNSIANAGYIKLYGAIITINMPVTFIHSYVSKLNVI